MLLSEIGDLQQGQTRFNRRMLCAIEKKSVFGIRCLLCGMRLKVFLYNRLNGGSNV